MKAISKTQRLKQYLGLPIDLTLHIASDKEPSEDVTIRYNRWNNTVITNHPKAKLLISRILRCLGDKDMRRGIYKHRLLILYSGHIK